MDVSKAIYPAIPHWVAGAYGLLAVITLPWTVYLAVTLPTRHVTTHWDVAWVGLDIAIILLLLLNAIFSYLESKWLVISSTVTSTILIIDAWFDIMSSRAGRQLHEAIAMAVIIELPLAIITFSVALKLVIREHINNLPVSD